MEGRKERRKLGEKAWKGEKAAASIAAAAAAAAAAVCAWSMLAGAQIAACISFQKKD